MRSSVGVVPRIEAPASPTLFLVTAQRPLRLCFGCRVGVLGSELATLEHAQLAGGAAQVAQALHSWSGSFERRGPH